MKRFPYKYKNLLFPVATSSRGDDIIVKNNKSGIWQLYDMPYEISDFSYSDIRIIDEIKIEEYIKKVKCINIYLKNIDPDPYSKQTGNGSKKNPYSNLARAMQDEYLHCLAEYSDEIMCCIEIHFKIYGSIPFGYSVVLDKNKWFFSEPRVVIEPWEENEYIIIERGSENVGSDSILPIQFIYIGNHYLNFRRLKIKEKYKRNLTYYPTDEEQHDQNLSADFFYAVFSSCNLYDSVVEIEYDSTVNISYPSSSETGMDIDVRDYCRLYQSNFNKVLNNEFYIKCDIKIVNRVGTDVYNSSGNAIAYFDFYGFSCNYAKNVKMYINVNLSADEQTNNGVGSCEIEGIFIDSCRIADGCVFELNGSTYSVNGQIDYLHWEDDAQSISMSGIDAKYIYNSSVSLLVNTTVKHEDDLQPGVGGDANIYGPKTTFYGYGLAFENPIYIENSQASIDFLVSYIEEIPPEEKEITKEIIPISGNDPIIVSCVLPACEKNFYRKYYDSDIGDFVETTEVTIPAYCYGG